MSQLKKLKKFIVKRQELASYYRKKIDDIEFISPAQKEFNHIMSNHIFPVRIDFEALKIKRNDLMIFLRQNSIYTQVHYIPIPIHPYYKNMGYEITKYKQNMLYFKEALTLPLYYQLEKSQVDYILHKLRCFFEEHNSSKII